MKKRPTKKQFIIWTTILSFITIALPFFLKSCEESWLTVYSSVLSAIGTVATFITLIIAFYLYEKFGLESKFIEKQTDTVLELINLLKGKTIYAHSIHGTYFLYPSCERIKDLPEFNLYKEDKKKKILISTNDYQKAWEKIFEIKRNYWLPKEIQEKFKFIEFPLSVEVEDSSDKNKYIRISFGENQDEKWTLPMPDLTFEEFNSGMFKLVKSIEDWLKSHSDFEIDFKMEEPINYKKQTED